MRVSWGARAGRHLLPPEGAEVTSNSWAARWWGQSWFPRYLLPPQAKVQHQRQKNPGAKLSLIPGTSNPLEFWKYMYLFSDIILVVRFSGRVCSLHRQKTRPEKSATQGDVWLTGRPLGVGATWRSGRSELCGWGKWIVAVGLTERFGHLR